MKEVYVNNINLTEVDGVEKLSSVLKTHNSKNAYDKANMILNKLNIEIRDYDNTTNDSEEKYLAKIECERKYVNDSSLDYNYYEDKIYINVDKNMSINEKIYLVFHEVGHYILHIKNKLDFTGGNMVMYCKEEQSNEIEEIEADQFAKEYIVTNREFIEAYRGMFFKTSKKLSRELCVPKRIVIEKLGELRLGVFC